MAAYWATHKEGIPHTLDGDEVPPAGAKPLFRATRSCPTMETSAQAAPQTYSEYAILGPGDPHPMGPEPQEGETSPHQAPKLEAKSNSIILSPWQRLKFVYHVPPGIWQHGS